MAFAHVTGAPLVVGAGAAGLTAALSLARRGPVTVLAAAGLEREAASGWAQGGIAAALGPDDSVDLHVEDTLAAGDGLCDAQAVRRIVADGPRAIERLAGLGARFDRDAHGGFRLGLEAAHGRRRIVHCGGDGAGREVLRTLAAAARAEPALTVVEGLEARRLIQDPEGRVVGVLAADPGGRAVELRARAVLLATGGIGGLYAHTTNPRGATGRGLAMAVRAGATLADMEFVQFHPTALAVGLDPMPLVSEAVRGEGAVLVDADGRRFMAGRGRAELEPRDVVARAVWAELAAGRTVFLDARAALGERFAVAFPAITAACRAAGVEPGTGLIPVRPAAHYHMGGVAVDGRGRTDVEGLWACGEVACTGLHGANRLASNSLLETLVCGEAAAEDILARAPSPAGGGAAPALPPPAEAGEVRRILDRHAGVLRDRPGLLAARDALRPLAFAQDAMSADAALVALFVVEGALQREESRGGHFRTDFPERGAQARSSRLGLSDVQDRTSVAAAA